MEPGPGSDPRQAVRGGYKICRLGHVYRGFDITCPYCSLLRARGTGRGPRLR